MIKNIIKFVKKKKKSNLNSHVYKVFVYVMKVIIILFENK